MVDVARMPDGSFGSVPTPAIVAPIEFTMRLDDYRALGGHTGRCAGSRTCARTPARTRVIGWPEENPWPLRPPPAASEERSHGHHERGRRRILASARLDDGRMLVLRHLPDRGTIEVGFGARTPAPSFSSRPRSRSRPKPPSSTPSRACAGGRWPAKAGQRRRSPPAPSRRRPASRNALRRRCRAGAAAGARQQPHTLRCGAPNPRRPDAGRQGAGPASRLRPRPAGRGRSPLALLAALLRLQLRAADSCSSGPVGFGPSGEDAAEMGVAAGAQDLGAVH